MTSWPETRPRHEQHRPKSIGVESQQRPEVSHGSSQNSPGGVKASSSGQHAGQVATLHHRQLAVHMGEAGVTLVPGVGKGGMGGFSDLRSHAMQLL
jgi:hypothetical protein